MSLAQIQEAPDRSVILLVGPPGAGKSAFCQQMVLNALALDRPVLYVTTERGTPDAIGLLKDRGLGERAPSALHFVDAFSQTVGVTAPERPDTIQASCLDLNSISIAITRLQERMGQSGILLVFDSLTSPYLFGGTEVVKFMRLFLSRFAAEGNSVVALIDEGCGKPEDLVALMSIADGVIELEIEKDRQLFNVVKHPSVPPSRIEVPRGETRAKKLYDVQIWDWETIVRYYNASQSGWFQQFEVNVFWPNFAFWSSMLWDPKGFPTMTYAVWREFGGMMRDVVHLFPWHMKLLFKHLIPRNLSRVQDMKKYCKLFAQRHFQFRRDGILEYLDDVSTTDEHYFRVYESRECWGLDNVGAAIGCIVPPLFAGGCKALEKDERDWNIVETKCIGLGDPYCEWRLVPGEIEGLQASLEKDISVVERIHEHLMQRLMGLLLDDTPLVNRPTLGSEFIMAHPDITLPAMAGERYRMALRMGGARAGKRVGERLMDAGLGEEEALGRVVQLLETCNVGKFTTKETWRMKDSCESIYIRILNERWEEPSCYFTTGFLNGLFSAVKNQHVREMKCIAMGDPYCEWEIL
jgi:predicted hydrocarbon binding protein/KaiC/GvpD/RAD55 family RecA-like ATPase